MPPLVAQVLVPLMTHSSVASSYIARVRIAPTSEPASGSEEQNAPSLRSPGRAVHLRHPLGDLLVGAVGAYAGGGERRADDREPDAGVTPEELLHGDREAEPGLVERLGDDEVDRVEAGLGRLLEDRPGELLPLVPLRGRRADDVGGEVVHPRLEVEVVLAEVERAVVRGHGREATALPDGAGRH